MMVCVIMHNIIIENEGGKDVDGHHYELMSHPVPVQQEQHRPLH
jgi:hypothetical protein